MDAKLIAVAVLMAIFFGLVIGGFIGVLQTRDTGMLEASKGVALSVAGTESSNSVAV
jgi:uncharacterized membrane protein